MWTIEDCIITYKRKSDGKWYTYSFAENEGPTTEDEAIKRFYEHHDKQDEIKKIEFKMIQGEKP